MSRKPKASRKPKVFKDAVEPKDVIADMLGHLGHPVTPETRKALQGAIEHTEYSLEALDLVPPTPPDFRPAPVYKIIERMARCARLLRADAEWLILQQAYNTKRREKLSDEEAAWEAAMGEEGLGWLRAFETAAETALKNLDTGKISTPQSRGGHPRDVDRFIVVGAALGAFCAFSSKPVSAHYSSALFQFTSSFFWAVTNGVLDHDACRHSLREAIRHSPEAQKRQKRRRVKSQKKSAE